MRKLRNAGGTAVASASPSATTAASSSAAAPAAVTTSTPTTPAATSAASGGAAHCAGAAGSAGTLQNECSDKKSKNGIAPAHKVLQSLRNTHLDLGTVVLGADSQAKIGWQALARSCYVSHSLSLKYDLLAMSVRWRARATRNNEGGVQGEIG